MIVKSLYVFLSIFAWQACGPLPGLDQVESLPVVTLPSLEEIKQGRADGKSFIVGLRNPSQTKAVSSFALEFSENQYQLESFADRQSELFEIEYLTQYTPEKLPKALPALSKQRFSLQASDSRPLSIAHLSFKDLAMAENQLREWEAQGILVFADPDWKNQLHDEKLEALPQQVTDTDNKNLQQIRVIDALNYLSTAGFTYDEVLNNAPVIAVFDSGVDIQHPDLEAAIFKNPKVGALCENDEYGCNTASPTRKKGFLGTGDVYPVFTNNHNEECPAGEKNGTCIHGTHVSGIAAGRIEANSGVGGVCPFCQIMPLKVVDGEGSIPDSALIRAMLYIEKFRTTDNKQVVRIINASLGKYQRSRAVSILARRLTESTNNGILIVGAAGNDDSGNRNYPAGVASAIAVSSLNADLKKSVFSNFGIWVDIAAPGKDIKSTTPGRGHSNSSGTSMAAPFVSGAAGLIFAAFPELTALEMKNRLIVAADASIYSTSVADGYNISYYPFLPGESTRVPLLGSGLLDVNQAMLNQVTPDYARISLKKRVEGCSIGTSHSRSPYLLWSMLLFPMLGSLITKLKFFKSAKKTPFV